MEDYIFHVDEEYRNNRAEEYTWKRFIIDLDKSEYDGTQSENEYQTAIKYCEKLFPSTFKRKSLTKIPTEAPKEPEESKERFEYLQFLYYMIVKNRECKQATFSTSDAVVKPARGQKGVSVRKVLESPSKRYLPIYNEMIREIQKKVSMEIREATDGLYAVKSEAALPDEGRYDDSIHTIQQVIEVIVGSLIYACDYGRDVEALQVFEHRKNYFRRAMEYLEKQDHPKVCFKTCWDELYARLNYNRCMYWEQDILSAYQEVKKAVANPPSKENKFYAMLKEDGREFVLENDCFLDFNSKNGKIEEVWRPNISREDAMNDIDPYAVSDIDSYITALEKYIGEHKEEIARKTFRKEKVDAEKRRIERQINKVCAYLRMEFQRYGRNSSITKSKLISIYQAYFLCLSGAGPKKRGSAKAQTPSGLAREKDSLSSTYSNAGEKDPYNLQLICIWTNYLFVWNTQGSFFAQKFLEFNILALNTMLARGYQSGMRGIQQYAEEVLLATMETLISDKDGLEMLEICVAYLQTNITYHLWGRTNHPSLILFGKFCNLFPKTFSLIEEKINSDKYMRQAIITLEEATENAFCITLPALRIVNNGMNNIYALEDFGIIIKKLR